MATYSLMDGASGRPGVGSSGTQPPASATAFTGSYCAGLVFKTTSGGIWLNAYRWWVPNSNGSTAAQKFALWALYTNGTGVLVPNSTVTSGTLTAGAFNVVSLPTPLLLATNLPYLAATGFPSTAPVGFPDTTNQLGVGDPYASGITNGPLFAYPSATVSEDYNWPNQPFSIAGSDPSTTLPAANNADDLLWIDVQCTDVAPGGFSSWRSYPNFPNMHVTTANDTTGYTLGLEFSLTQACTLRKIWHYSVPAGNAALPTRCLIWDVGGTSAVPGTDNAAPSWINSSGGAASPGDGWIYCDYSGAGVTLAGSTNYKVSTFHAAGTTWFGATPNLFGVGNPFAGGWTQGPLVVPDDAHASPGQQSWHTVTFAYPNTSTNPEADWVDVEVAPVTAAGGALIAAWPP